MSYRLNARHSKIQRSCFVWTRKNREDDLRLHRYEGNIAREVRELQQRITLQHEPSGRCTAFLRPTMNFLGIGKELHPRYHYPPPGSLAPGWIGWIYGRTTN
eukprot:SAG31_NODE_3859_length_3814_cov_2.456528_1_plen_102_part_00